MKKIKDFFNHKGIIRITRGIGMLYLIAILINTIFFYGQYMYETFLGSGLCGIIAATMIGYKLPFHKSRNEVNQEESGCQ